jgi:hypothetical protein
LINVLSFVKRSAVRRISVVSPPSPVDRRRITSTADPSAWRPKKN